METAIPRVEIHKIQRSVFLPEAQNAGGEMLNMDLTADRVVKTWVIPDHFHCANGYY